MAKTATKPKNAPTRLTAEIGYSGPKQFGGTVFEEFDADLRGIRGVRVFEEMRRNDPMVAAGLRAIMWVLGQVNWTVEPGGESPADKEAAEFLDSCRQDMVITWSKLIRDVLSCLVFGFAYFEAVYKQRTASDGGESRYDDGRIGWHKWSLLSHETLLNWDMDELTGETKGFVQMPVLAGISLSQRTIPIEKAVLFRIEDERNNPEGVSLLRPCYLPYYMKKQIEEIEAIGIERDLTGVLVIRMPVGATETDKRKAVDLLEQFRADDMAGFIAPRNGPNDSDTWDFEIINSPGNKTIDADKVITRYQFEIARTFLAQFLLLGAGTTGSFALGADQRDMFETALGAILMNVEETMNRFMVPPLFRYNDFGKLTALPRIKTGKISKKNIDKFSTGLKNLTDAGLLTPDPGLERFIREEADLPELPKEAEQKPVEDTGQEEEDGEAFSESWQFHLGGKHNQQSHAAKSIGSDAEAKTFLNQHYGGWKKGLDAKEDAGMAFYQSPGYELMNNSLRGMPVSAPPKDMKRAKDAVKGMDSAIAKAPPLEGGGLKVYRGFSADQFKLEPGAVVTDKGFVSTSLTKGQAGSYTSRGRQAMATIYLPNGTKAAAGSIKELVLPRGSSFRVVSTKQVGKVTHVDMELVL